MANRTTRAVAFSSVISLAVVLLAWLVTVVASLRSPATLAIGEVGGFLAPLVLIVLVLSIAAVVLAARREPASSPADREEPLLRRPHLPLVTRNAPVVTVVGVQPKVGSSTLAANLAALIVAEGDMRTSGESRRPRPVCVIAEGHLAEAMGVSAEPLSAYLADHPGYIRGDVLNLVVNHLAGFDLLCIRGGQVESAQLPRLLDALRREYDVVVIDCPLGADLLAAAAAHHGDAVLVCSQPSAGSASAAARWAVRCWDLGEERKTVVVVNRMRAGTRVPRDLESGFLYRAEVPDDPVVSELDAVGRPWALSLESSAAGALREVARRLLPELLGGEARHAA